MFLKFALTLLFVLSSCAPALVATPPDITQKPFPTIRSTSLAGQSVTIPDDFRGTPTVLLVGYVQRAQFDIDRWILGILQAEIPVRIVEIPTIAGMAPQAIQPFIDNGMRSGIPKQDWASVVPVYKEASTIIAAIGNERPQSAHAVLLDSQGRITWTSNIGYSATQILELKEKVAQLPKR